MPYPTRLLNDGETVELDLRPHWWYFAKHIAGSIVLIVLLALLLRFTSHPKSGFDSRDVSFIAWAVLALVWAGWLVLRYFNWTFTHFVITSSRVIFRTGVLAKHGVEIPMDRINNINFHQGIWERIIGAGDLEIESAGKDGQSKFNDVWHPDAVQQELYRVMEDHQRTRAGWASGGGQAPAAPAAPSLSVADQIQQLAGLRDSGAITAAEYEAKKAQLLERM